MSVSAWESLLQELEARFGRWIEDEGALEAGRMSADLYPYEALFSPIQINGVKVKNRIIMGPMGNLFVSNPLGKPDAKLIAYYEARAKGGAGLITSGLVPIDGKVEPAVTGRWNDAILPRLDGSFTVISGWKDLVAAVHAHGARFFMQLTPGFGRVGPPLSIFKLRLPVSSSWHPNHHVPQLPCRPLSDRECRRLIKGGGQMAVLARGCGVDGVYLHGHEGYLLEQLTNPAFNNRLLSHFSDWQTFGLELVREIRRKVGPRYPIMYRIDLSLALNATYGERMEEVRLLRRFRDERTVEMTLAYMRNLVAEGVDIFDVDLGCYENWWLPHPPNGMPPGCFLPVARLVKRHFEEEGVLSNAGLPVPVVAVGKLGYPDLAEGALRAGDCDMVMLARPLLADPDWPHKAYAGRVDEIIPCIGDQACLGSFQHLGHSVCTVNPRTYFEDALPEPPEPALEPERIAVVGAGPAGVVCACTLARRGHRVVLYERGARVGGMLLPGSVPRMKFDLVNYLDYLNAQVALHAERYGLEARFGTEATAGGLKEEGFDAIVTCTGAQVLRPSLPGIDLPHVVTAVDLLRESALAEGAERVAVVGGGEVGCEVAHFLAYELGKEAAVIEMLPYFMPECCQANRGYLLHYLERAGVELLNATRLVRVEPEAVVVLRNVAPGVPDPYVTWTPLVSEDLPNPLARPLAVEEQEAALPAELVVLATGMRADDGLYEACIGLQAARRVELLGDAFSPASILEATRAGYRVGRSL
ncbi:MAG: FAD-dependent oxidoreductase [Anaerolineales bacterium]